MMPEKDAPAGRRGLHPIYLLLLAPYAAWAWVPFYNRIAPVVLSIPFFYWWQIFSIILTSACILLVYLHEERR